MQANEPQLFALFCDSVRQEVSGTQSLIGVYQDQILVDSFPINFPRLTVFATLHTRELVTGSFDLDVYNDDTQSVLMNVSASDIRPEVTNVALNDLKRGQAGFRTVVALEGQNLQFVEATHLKVRCRLNSGEEYISPTRLIIKLRKPDHRQRA